MIQRHYVDRGSLEYDPRFLAFEFINNLVLRKQQCELVVRFVSAAAQGRSLCHQLIMGAGKTTVVAPLLALILGDGSQLLCQVRAARARKRRSRGA